MRGRGCRRASRFSSFFTSRKIEKICAIVEAQLGIYIATLPSILILKQCGHQWVFNFLLLYYSACATVSSSFRILEVQNRFSSHCKLVHNRFSIFPNGAKSIFRFFFKWRRIDFYFSKWCKIDFVAFKSRRESILWLLKVGGELIMWFLKVKQ